MKVLSRALVSSLWLTVLAGCAPPPPVPAPSPSPVAAPPAVPAPLPAPVEVPTTDYYRAAEGRGTRQASGAPGDAYWQNRASYRIEAELDPATATIRGVEQIVYRNLSPDTLRSIVLNLYQNIFTGSVPRNRFAPVTGGVTVEWIAVNGAQVGRRSPNEIPVISEVPGATPGYSIQGTLGRIQLPRAILHGDSATLEVFWEYRIPPTGGFRTAWEDAFDARAFLVAQWYPQVAVYDDLRGWDATPYLGDGEFYLEYGDFDVAITVPTGFLVGATGELVNPEEVLTEEAQRRLAAAAQSDSVTRIVTDADLSADNATQHVAEGQLTWRFIASGVRDFAFATSAGYVWDATRATGESSGASQDVAVHAFYRPGAPHWESAAAFARDATTVIGEEVIAYPYPQITVAEGPIGGMEYPMLTFIGRPAAEPTLYSVIAHEIAHEWFPMLVGQDEAAFAWMDEGAATFLEAVAVGKTFDVSDPHEGDRRSYLNAAGGDTEVSMMTHTDLVSPYGARNVAAYYKPATLLHSLTNLLGPDRFRMALRTFAREWANRHPTPWDFFRTLERVHGEPLGWFFKPWWFSTAVLDHAIEAVEWTDDGAIVRVSRRGTAPAPTIVVGWTAAGDSIVSILPFDGWVDADTASVFLPSTSPIVRASLDPSSFYPDVDTENDVWPSEALP